MIERSVSIAGIRIPSSDPVFLTIIAVHVLLGLSCVVAGALAMLAVKGRGRHAKSGTFYYWSMAGIFASSTLLSIIRWAEDYHLFILGTLGLAAAHFGRTAQRRRWSHANHWHIVGMGTSYVLLLTAFYVDNGKQLPLWRDLPFWTYWALQPSIGAPLMVWALLRHPRARVERDHAFFSRARERDEASRAR